MTCRLFYFAVCAANVLFYGATSILFVARQACADESTRAVAVATAAPTRGLDVTDAIVETFQQRNGTIFEDWKKPRALLVITGELNGYIEPCGCTGKEKTT